MKNLRLIFLTLLICSCSSEQDSSSPISNSRGKGVQSSTPCAFDFSENPSLSSSGSRSFYMGFTTFNYAMDDKSQDQIYEKISDNDYGDILGLHYNDGVPWGYGNDAIYDPAALYSFYPSNFQDFINKRIDSTVGASTLYVAIDQTSTKRDDIAPDYFGGSKPSNFNTDAAEWAYANFVLVVLHRVYTIYNENSKPLPKIYLNLSSEVSDLIAKNATNNGQASDYILWHEIIDLIDFTNSTLDSYTHSDSVFQNFVRGATTMVSVALKSPKDGTPNNESMDKSEAIEKEFPDIHPYVDMIGVSTYGYIFYDNQFGGGNPDTLRGDPSLLENDWLSQTLATIAGSKDVAITETSWIANDFDVLMNSTYIISSSDQRQKEYLLKTLVEMNSNSRWKFLIWFNLVDYDPMWSTWDSTTQIFALIWRNTGLFDVDASTMANYNDGCIAKARPAWSTWSEWLSKTNTL